MIWKGSVRIGALLLVAAMVMSAGCAKKKQAEPLDPDFGMNNGPETSSSGDGQPDLDLESLLFSRDSGLQPIYFDFDSSSLNPRALSILSSNADLIKRAPGIIIQVAGHCDERGTQEYNLALGERRALAVRGHLMSLGVSGDRMITISYGEEFPAVQGSGEAAYSQNRRCEFNKAQSF